MHTELNTLALISEVTGMILFAAAWAAERPGPLVASGWLAN